MKESRLPHETWGDRRLNRWSTTLPTTGEARSFSIAVGATHLAPIYPLLNDLDFWGPEQNRDWRVRAYFTRLFATEHRYTPDAPIPEGHVWLRRQDKHLYTTPIATLLAAPAALELGVAPGVGFQVTFEAVAGKLPINPITITLEGYMSDR